MGKIDPAKAPLKTGSIYPAPYDARVQGRSSLRLGEAGGLSQFGANLVILTPGARSSMRHWHLHEDEFVMVTEGTVILEQDAGDTVMEVGDCAAFPAGHPDGHSFVNRSDAEARFLVIGTKAVEEHCTYPDDDLNFHRSGGKVGFTRHDGTPYPPDQDI